jgi:hypothetical protein
MLKFLARTFFVAAATVLFAVQGLSSAGASTLTYDVSLSGLTLLGNSATGSGVVTVNAPAQFTGTESLASAMLTIGETNFRLNSLSSGSVSLLYNAFTKAEVVTGFSFSGTNGTSQLTISDVLGLGSYSFTNSTHPLSSSFGSASVSAGVGATPLPGTLPLFATLLVLLGLALWFWRPGRAGAVVS